MATRRSHIKCHFLNQTSNSSPKLQSSMLIPLASQFGFVSTCFYIEILVRRRHAPPPYKTPIYVSTYKAPHPPASSGAILMCNPWSVELGFGGGGTCPCSCLAWMNELLGWKQTTSGPSCSFQWLITHTKYVVILHILTREGQATWPGKELYIYLENIPVCTKQLFPGALQQARK